MSWNRSLLFCLLLGFYGCVPREPPEPLLPPPVPTAPLLSEEDVRPIARPDLHIESVQSEPAADGSGTRVTGILVNRGNGPARTLEITVRVFDAQGGLRQQTTAHVDRIPLPAGASTSFSATLGHDPEAEEIRVEAIGK